MRHLLIAAFVASTPLLAQNFPISGNCEYGGKTVVTGSLVSTTKVQASYPGCTVNVYITGTLTHASIFNSSGTPIGNPLTADITTGLWSLWTATGVYDVRLSGGSNGGIPTPYTVSYSIGGSGSGGGGINALAGPVTASGSGTVVTTITPTGVTAASYTNANVTFNAAGQATAASNGSGGGGGTGTVVGPSTSVVNDVACWNNTIGTLLSDCGSSLSLLNFVQGGGTSPTTENALIKAMEQFSVTDYGADKTGATNATTSFQNAINYAAGARNGGAVFMPCGTYMLAGTVTISKQNVSLIGENENCVKLNYTGSDSAIVWQMSSPFGTDPAGEMSGFTLSGTAAALNGILSGQIVGSHWRNIDVSGFINVGAAAIHLHNSGSFSTWTERNVFENVSTGGTGGFRNTYGFLLDSDNAGDSFGYNDFLDIKVNVSTGQEGFRLASGFFYNLPQMNMVCNMDNTLAGSVGPICIHSMSNWDSILLHLNGEYQASGAGVGTPFRFKVDSGARFSNMLGSHISVFAPGGAQVADSVIPAATNSPNVTLVQSTSITSWDTGTFTLNGTATTPQPMQRANYGSLGLLIGNNIESPYVSMFNGTGNKFIVGSVPTSDNIGQMFDVFDVGTFGEATAYGKLFVSPDGRIAGGSAPGVIDGNAAVLVGGYTSTHRAGLAGSYWLTSTGINETMSGDPNFSGGWGYIEGVNISHPMAWAYTLDPIDFGVYEKAFQSPLSGSPVFYITHGGGTVATNTTDTSLNPGDCVQASTGGLLVTTGAPCGTGGGSGITALTGPVTASGSGSVVTTITPTGVTAASYTNANITVNAAGQITVAANGAGATNAFSALTSGTNTGMAALCGTGCSIGVTGSGAINVPVADITGLGTGIGTFLVTPSSANLAAAVTGETGTGALVFNTNTTLINPALGTPASGIATNLTQIPGGQIVGTASVPSSVLPLATNAVKGAMEGDTTTVSCAAGICSSTGGIPTVSTEAAASTIASQLNFITGGGSHVNILSQGIGSSLKQYYSYLLPTATWTANDCLQAGTFFPQILGTTPCSGGSSSFSSLTSGTNTAAAMVIGTGASLTTSGSGTNAATTMPGGGLTGANSVPASTLPLATTGAFGAVKCDGTTTTCSSGVITAVAAIPPLGPSGALIVSGGNLDVDPAVVPLLANAQHFTGANLFDILRVHLYTVASLPTCNGGSEGQFEGVTNAAATPVYNAIAAGGGTVHIPVYCDGTNWRNH